MEDNRPRGLQWPEMKLKNKPESCVNDLFLKATNLY